MYSLNNNVCCFYASELHLTTILMEYIYGKTKDGKKILNVLENDLTSEIELISEIYKGENRIIRKIKNYNWNKFDKSKLNKIKDIKKEDLIIIIAGSKKFIEEVNKYIPKFENIVECYELLDNAEDAMEILNSHEFILKTTGIEKIDKIFI